VVGTHAPIRAALLPSGFAVCPDHEEGLRLNAPPEGW
jgi:hypothetical protein